MRNTKLCLLFLVFIQIFYGFSTEQHDKHEEELHIHHTFSEFPEQVFSLHWCKKDTEIMFALSMAKILYISKNKGKTWSSMSKLLRTK